MSKKILSVVLALALVCSCFAVSAFAVGGMGYEDDATAYTQTWELQTPVQNGTTWTVDVKLTTTAPEGEVYKVGSMQFKVLGYQDTAITLDSFTASSAIPENWLADTKASNDTGKVIINPNPTEDAVDGIDCAEGVIIGTLTFTVPEDASATINIEDVEKTAANPAGSLIAARMSDGNVVTGTSIVGQDATVGAAQQLGVTAAPTTPPTLQAIDGTIGVVDTSRTDLNMNEGTTCDGYIYGLEPFNYETVDAVFEVVGDGTMNIVANDYGLETGTGTMVQVLDLNGDVVAEYVLVVFGDVDGDGAVTTDDASLVELSAGYAFADTATGQFDYDYQKFAACVDGCGEHSTDDSSIIELCAGYAYPDDLGNGYLTQESIIAGL